MKRGHIGAPSIAVRPRHGDAAPSAVTKSGTNAPHRKAPQPISPCDDGASAALPVSTTYEPTTTAAINLVFRKQAGMHHVRVTANGVQIAGQYHPAQIELDGAPLVVAIHGGTYTSAYYRVPGSPAGSFVDTVTRVGLPVLTIDRPCYGASDHVSQDRLQFPDQAALLNTAIEIFLTDLGHRSVALVGHSIGGMISVEMAAAARKWTMTSLSLSGMGARLAGSSAHKLAEAAVADIVDLPVATRESVFLGPPSTCTDNARQAARSSYSAAPRVEFHQAPQWIIERLGEAAGDVREPIHHAIADADVLFESSDNALTHFVALFDADQVRSERVAGAGHSIDHHEAAAWFHLRQCAFILEHAQSRVPQ